MRDQQQPAVRLSISFSDGDGPYLDRQTRILQRDLTSIGVPADFVREASSPEGTRGVAEIIGLLQIATLLPVAVPKLMEVLQSWITSRKGVTIKIKVGDIEVEATGGDVEKARQLLADVERLARPRSRA